MTISRSAVRTKQFDELVEKLAAQIDRAEEIIYGALWELARKPEMGVHLAKFDVWMATFEYPPIRLYYCRNRRYIHALTMESTDPSLIL